MQEQDFDGGTRIGGDLSVPVPVRLLRLIVL